MSNRPWESRKENAYRVIQQRILDLTWKPGDLISEAQLESELGMSRTPIREALVRLQEDGLVEIVPRRGVIVRGLTGRAIREMFEVRLVLESYAVEHAGEKGNEALCRCLRQILDRQKHAVADGDDESFMSLDSEFHQSIVRRLGNDKLDDMLSAVKKQLEQVGIRSLTIHTNMALAVEQHEYILEALERNDPQGAKAAIREHLRRMRDVVLLGQ